jgi:hypothetical protein
MIAYKFLRLDGTAVFSGFPWPLPTNGRAAAWVEAPIDPCRSGVHACRTSDLPYWAGPVLYEIELDGDIVEQRSKVVAARGRILRQIDEWDERVAEEYTRMCANRARELALGAERPMPDWADAALAAVPEGPALLGFCAARIAEEIDGVDGYRRERETQSRWLVRRLGLGAGRDIEGSG